jgi:hypothetical protein
MTTPNLSGFHRRCFLLSWVVFVNKAEILRRLLACLTVRKQDFLDR